MNYIENQILKQYVVEPIEKGQDLVRQKFIERFENKKLGDATYQLLSGILVLGGFLGGFELCKQGMMETEFMNSLTGGYIHGLNDFVIGYLSAVKEISTNNEFRFGSFILITSDLLRGRYGYLVNGIDMALSIRNRLVKNRFRKF